MRSWRRPQEVSDTDTAELVGEAPHILGNVLQSVHRELTAAMFELSFPIPQALSDDY